MFGGVSKAGWATILASGVLLGGSISAQAADLGGDCCADLEERVAELEATTARKGNRKVSLEVSGHINEAIMFWDDGSEENVYVVGNDSGRSRFRFKGKAKINNDWSAGYLIEIGVRTHRSDRVDQGPPPLVADVTEGASPLPTLDIRHSVWNLTSKTYGGVYVGWSNSATESITEANITQTKDIAKNSDTEDQAAGFQLRNSAGGLSAIEWRRLVKDDFIQPGEGSRGNNIRYVSPEFGGFWAEASFGQDDMWATSINWKGHEGGFKWLAGFGYSENTETVSATMPCIVSPSNGDAECNQYGGSFSVLHEDSGLFVNFGAGQFVDEKIDTLGGFSGALNTDPDDESTFYSVQAGIEKKFIELGKTTVYGEYFDHDGGANDRSVSVGDAINPFANSARIWNSEVRTYGVGVIQGIDAAAMRLYAFWRHYEADVTMREQTTGNLEDVQLEDLDVITAGALIQF
jgi:predicted porin